MAKTLADEKLEILISNSTCQHKFGFLGQRPKGTDIPDECLTCEKMLDCMFSERKDDYATQVTEQHVPEPEKAEDVATELEPETITPAEEPAQAISEPSEANGSITPMANDVFVVENAGMLYAQWSTTVLINKETLQTLGKKVKEVEVETETGKRTKLKIHPVEEVKSKTIMVPDKVQLILGVKKGSIVKVKPIAKS